MRRLLTPRVTRLRGVSLLEMIALVVVVGVLASLTAGVLLPAQQSMYDKAAPVLLAGATLDARAVATANAYQLPADTAALTTKMNNVAVDRSSDEGMTVTYVAGPVSAPKLTDGDGVGKISVAASTPASYGLAMAPSSDGASGTCMFALDQLRTGTTYAQMTKVPEGSTLCSAQTVVACAADLPTLDGNGTFDKPKVLPATHPCVSR